MSQRPVVVREGERRASPHCPYCRGSIDAIAPSWRCPECSTRHHEDCARENGRCTLLGCRGVFAEPLIRIWPRGRNARAWSANAALTAAAGSSTWLLLGPTTVALVVFAFGFAAAFAIQVAIEARVK